MSELDDANGLIKQAKLAEARKLLAMFLKENPGHQRARNTYFETLCFLGEYDRAHTQLETLMTLGTGGNPAIPGRDTHQIANLYFNALSAEKARRDFYESGRVPEFLRVPPDSIRYRLEASLELRSGSGPQAVECLRKAEQLELPVEWSIDGRAHSGIRDADDLLGPVLEFLTSTGEYCWIELNRIQAIYFRPLQYWLDTLWRPATVMTLDAGATKGLLPVLYYGSHLSEQGQIQVGHSTEWDDSQEFYRGLGQRMFVAGEDFFPVLELQTLLATGADLAENVSQPDEPPNGE
ncbi:MAG: hypothetical protein KDA88_02460 [Planctomycetaceae bacterium]|nr:hypothetical protein [Planctomycetaceae bacterium]